MQTVLSIHLIKRTKSVMEFGQESVWKIAWNPRLNRKYFTGQLFLRCESGHFWDDSFRAAVLSIHCMHSVNKTMKQTKAFRCTQKSRSRETIDRPYWYSFFVLLCDQFWGWYFFFCVCAVWTTKCNKPIWNMDALKLNECSMHRCDQQPQLLCAHFVFPHYNIIL